MLHLRFNLVFGSNLGCLREWYWWYWWYRYLVQLHWHTSFCFILFSMLVVISSAFSFQALGRVGLWVWWCFKTWWLWSAAVQNVLHGGAHVIRKGFPQKLSKRCVRPEDGTAWRSPKRKGRACLVFCEVFKIQIWSAQSKSESRQIMHDHTYRGRQIAGFVEQIWCKSLGLFWDGLEHSCTWLCVSFGMVGCNTFFIIFIHFQHMQGSHQILYDLNI